MKAEAVQVSPQERNLNNKLTPTGKYGKAEPTAAIELRPSGTARGIRRYWCKWSGGAPWLTKPRSGDRARFCVAP